MRGDVEHVCHFVEADIVDMDDAALGFQIDQRHIFGADIASSDFNARAVNHVVAVRFDDECMVPVIRQFDEQ